MTKQVKTKNLMGLILMSMKGGKILDDTRIRRVIPGLKILANSAKQIFLITHFGRPKGAVSKDLSVRPLQDYLKSTIMQCKFSTVC